MESSELEYIEYIKEAPLRLFVVALESSSLHWHEEYEIVFALRGTLRVNVEGEEHRLRQGDLLLINPKRVHSFAHGPKHNVCLILQFSAAVVLENYKHTFTFDLTPDTSPGPEVLTEFRRRLAGMGLLLRLRPDGYQFEIKAELYFLIALMFRTLRYSPASETISPHDYLADFDLIKAYIKAHYLDTIDPASIGRALGMSYSKVYRTLRQAGSPSAGELINYYRTEHAKHLLINTERSVSLVAAESGFASDASFFRVFKTMTGYSPSEYRKRPAKNVILHGVQRYATPSPGGTATLLREYASAGASEQ